MKEHLLLVPGIDGTGKLFYRQIPSLERNFTVTAMRLRDDALTMDDLVADLHAEVERVSADGGRVSLLGESFGGALTLSYAVAHPERVDRLVIVNSFAHFGSQARLWLGYHLLRATPWGMMRIVRQLNARRMHSPHTERDEIRRFHELMRAATREGYLSRMRILRDYDIRHQLPSISAPVLYLAADRDTLVPSVEQARLMSALTPRAKMRILEGHGHSCLIAPDMDLAAIVADWLGAEDGMDRAAG
ncbi:MAG TPA: alpha/beta fold hydrolase [Vicinamibacterales bacterium]|nr:alpha/beta fold hydrolase [Vicinamibacterales bacterium]